MNDGSPGAVVDALTGDGGGVRVRPLSGGRMEVMVLPASGTFPAMVTVSREDAAALGAELILLAGTE
jgi:hypothetical protein